MFMFLHNSTQSKQMTTLQSLGSAGGSSHRGVFPGHCGIMFALEGSVGFLFEESHGVMHPARSDFFSLKVPFFFFQTSFNSLLWKSKNNQCIFLVHTSGSQTRMDLTGSGIPRKPGLNGVCRRVDLSSCCVFPLEWPAWSYQKYETRAEAFIGLDGIINWTHWSTRRQISSWSHR